MSIKLFPNVKKFLNLNHFFTRAYQIKESYTKLSKSITNYRSELFSITNKFSNKLIKDMMH